MKGLFKHRGNSVKDPGSPRQRRSLGNLFGNPRNSSETPLRRESSASLEKLSGTDGGDTSGIHLDIEERVYQHGALPLNLFSLVSLTPKGDGEYDAKATSAKRKEPTSFKPPPRREFIVDATITVVSPTGEPGDNRNGNVNEDNLVAKGNENGISTADATKADTDIDDYNQAPSEFFSYNTKIINLILDYCSGDINTLCKVSMLNMTWMERANDDSRWRSHFEEQLSNGRSTIGLDENLSCKTKCATLWTQSKLSGKKASKIANFARNRKGDTNASNASPRSSISDNETESKTPASPSTPPEESKSKSQLSRTASKVKQLTPTDPVPYYSMDILSIEYREDGDDAVKWGQDANGKTVVEAATLNKLIELLTSPDYFDQHFLHTFIITYRSLMDRESLINRLIERYNIPPPDGLDPEKFAEFKRNKLDKIRLRVTNTVKYWLENFYVFDFDEEMIKHYERLVTMMEKSKGEALARMLRNSMEKANEKATANMVTTGKLDCLPVMYPKKSLFGKAKSKDDIMNWPVVEVARQITLIDFGLFSKIDPKECLNQSWNKEHRTEKAPNISNFIEQFNHLSKWIGTVVVKTEDLEKRAKMVCKFIDLAEVCKDLNNFNGLFSVLSGLKLSGVYRLKETWKTVPEEYVQKYDTLSEYMKNDSNFKNVRSAIKAVKPPCIPYIGLYLTDLTFIEDGMPKYDDEDKTRINFEKCSKFAEVIRDMQTYQNQRYALTEVPEVQDILLHSEIMSEEDMFKQSLKIEARKKKTKKPKTDS